MSIGTDAIIAAAGFAAGMINTIVGSGSLITFPTLVYLGYSPLVANVSNTVGLVPGSVSGAIGYRKELAGQGVRALRLGIAALVGGVLGGVLLIVFPGAFQVVVPYLVLLAVGLVIFQPRISRAILKTHGSDRMSLPLYLGAFLTAVYGGYFGAAQGVILLAIFAIFINDTLQRLNGLKNVLAGIVNGVAGILFLVVAHVAYLPALIIAVFSALGAQLGAKVGRRIPPKVLRGVIITVGTTVAIKLLFFP